MELLRVEIAQNPILFEWLISRLFTTKNNFPLAYIDSTFKSSKKDGQVCLSDELVTLSNHIYLAVTSLES